MFFTPGNIITIGIVALALIIYRLQDKSNRPSLEKLKKYTDRCKEEIAAYADEKSMAVKNFGIDLDVEKKAAAQYLKNIQKLTEEELAKKSHAIANIEGHIKKFESSLEDLHGMTDRVQENLNRIRDESVFVENTGRRVTEAKDKFEQIEKLLTAAEKNMTETEIRLEKKGQEFLDKTARDVLTNAKSIVSDFEATAQVIERKVEDHKAALVKAEREREAVISRDLEIIKKTLKDTVENAGKRANSLEDAAFVKLRDQAQERVSNIKVFFEDKLKTTQNALLTEQNGINEKIRILHDKWTEIDKQRKELDASITELRAKSAATIKQQQTESNELIAKINTSISELQMLAKNIQKQQQEELETVLTEMRKKTDSSLKLQQSELSSAIANHEQTIESTLKDFREKSNSTISKQQNEITFVINDFKERAAQVITGQQSELASVIKDLKEKTTTAVTGQQNELTSALKTLKEKTTSELNEELNKVESVIKDIKTKTDAAIANQEANLTTELNRQMEEWQHLCKDTEQDIIAANEKRLEEYNLRQAEAVRQLNSLADDAAKLKTELTLSMKESVAKAKKEYSDFEKEAEASMEKTASSFSAQAQAFKNRLDEMDKELNKIRQQALDNTSKRLMGFEKDFAADLARKTADIGKQIDTWQDGFEQKLEKSAEKINKNWQKAEEKLNNDRIKSVTQLGEKLTAELARLKQEIDAFEKGIREEMINLDKAKTSFAEQVEKDISEIRLTAENEAKNQVGQYQLSLQETLREKQRELEKEIKDITERSKAAYDALDEAAIKTRETYDDWESSYNNKMREMDNALEAIRKNSRETANENDERIAHFRQNLEDVRKEMAAQKKIFDQANDTKQKLERRIEEMNADLNRLEQRKAEVADLEQKFTNIKRTEEEINRKMQSFLSERHRLELMQKDFESFKKTEQIVREKALQVSTSDDILSNVQVQIRKLEDSIKITEERYQKIERKNEMLEQTNDGIDRNFKTLQQTEAAIKNAEKVITGLSEQFNSTRTSIEALAKESLKAKEASEKITILDEDLAKIEKRIQEMTVAREWLARTETELKKLDNDLKEQVRRATNLSKKEGSKFSVTDTGKGAPAPRVRENVLALKEKGWTVEEIANVEHLSKGEVELILEIGSRG